MFNDSFFAPDPFERFFKLLAPNVDMTDAKLLDEHTFSKNGITYNQKVYRLKDHQVYTETSVVEDKSIESLTAQMHEAAEKEDYERAAYLRNQINALKKS